MKRDEQSPPVRLMPGQGGQDAGYVCHRLPNSGIEKKQWGLMVQLGQAGLSFYPHRLDRTGQ